MLLEMLTGRLLSVLRAVVSRAAYGWFLDGLPAGERASMRPVAGTSECTGPAAADGTALAREPGDRGPVPEEEFSLYTRASSPDARVCHCDESQYSGW